MSGSITPLPAHNPDDVDGGDFHTWVVEALAAAVPPSRAAELGLLEALSAPIDLPSGADSRVIWLLDTRPRSVLKVGRKDVAELEIAFLCQTLEAGVSIFPRILAHGALGTDAWYLMEAGIPDSGEEVVFATPDKEKLQPDWQERLSSLLRPVADLYLATVAPGPCTVSDYHYRQRIQNLFSRADFREVAAGFGVPMPVEKLLEAPIRLNGAALPPLAQMLHAAIMRMPSPSVRAVTMIHGDLHLKNMVRQELGDSFMFVDPRLQWDGMPIGKFGYGDPVYDLATMLHSVGGMTTILTAIEHGSTDGLVAHRVEDGRIIIDLAPGLTQLINNTAAAFPTLGEALLPEATRGDTYRLRLFIGAANATFGWLKYADAVKTSAAWWLIFALGLTFLSTAIEQVS